MTNVQYDYVSHHMTDIESITAKLTVGESVVEAVVAVAVVLKMIW